MATAGVSEGRPLHPLLPMECTRDAPTGPQRLGECRVVRSDLVKRDAQPGSVVLHFGDRPGLGAELARLVDAERACCSFLGWAVQPEPGGWRIAISGDDEALAALPTGR